MEGRRRVAALPLSEPVPFGLSGLDGAWCGLARPASLDYEHSEHQRGSESAEGCEDYALPFAEIPVDGNIRGEGYPQRSSGNRQKEDSSEDTRRDEYRSSIHFFWLPTAVINGCSQKFSR